MKHGTTRGTLTVVWRITWREGFEEHRERWYRQALAGTAVAGWFDGSDGSSRRRISIPKLTPKQAAEQVAWNKRLRSERLGVIWSPHGKGVQGDLPAAGLLMRVPGPGNELDLSNEDRAVPNIAGKRAAKRSAGEAA